MNFLAAAFTRPVRDGSVCRSSSTSTYSLPPDDRVLSTTSDSTGSGRNETFSGYSSGTRTTPNAAIDCGLLSSRTLKSSCFSPETNLPSRSSTRALISTKLTSSRNVLGGGAWPPRSATTSIATTSPARMTLEIRAMGGSPGCGGKLAKPPQQAGFKGSEIELPAELEVPAQLKQHRLLPIGAVGRVPGVDTATGVQNIEDIDVAHDPSPACHESLREPEIQLARPGSVHRTGLDQFNVDRAVRPAAQVSAEPDDLRIRDVVGGRQLGTWQVAVGPACQQPERQLDEAHECAGEEHRWRHVAESHLLRR